MGLWRFLFGRAPRDDAPPAEIAVADHVRFDLTSLVQSDRREDTTQKKAGRYVAETDAGTIEHIDLPDVFCILEYRDAQGVETHRRVTLRKLAFSGKLPMLHAICHERRAARHFRLDRVQAFITQDGEALPVAVFFRQVMNIDLSFDRPFTPQTISTARAAIDAVRDPLNVLVAIALSDSDFHAAEVDVIEAFLERDLLRRDRLNQISLDHSFILNGHLAAAVRATRPRQTGLAASLRKIAEWPAERINDFAGTAERLITADGRIAREEIDLVEDLAVFARGDFAARMAALHREIEGAAAQ